MGTIKQGQASSWFLFSALCFAILLALYIPFQIKSTTALSVFPSPLSQPPETALPNINQPQDEKDNFPKVDWDYWKAINPSIIAWVTVPNTNIDYAVVQAPANDPTYYLYHDIYMSWNPYGCPYVDADCEGLAGFNTIVFGHNMGYDSSMFSDFAKFSDLTFAQDHPEIFMQTPTERLVLDISAVAIVQGSEQSKKTDFISQQELASWYTQRYEISALKISDDPQATRLFTFVTCSYHYFANERTLVYAQPHK
jgi:sortase B